MAYEDFMSGKETLSVPASPTIGQGYNYSGGPISPEDPSIFGSIVGSASNVAKNIPDIDFSQDTPTVKTGTMIAPLAPLGSAGVIVGTGLEVVNLIAKYRNQVNARKEAKAAKAEALQRYNDAIAREGAQFKEQMDLKKKQYGLTEKQALQAMRNDRKDRDQSNKDKTYMMKQNRKDKWLSALKNNPNAKELFRQSMRGVR